MRLFFDDICDSRSTDHVTNEMEKMTVHDMYKGHDLVHNASGFGMSISNVGHTILHTLNCVLHLQNIIRLSSTHKSLIFLHKLATDNKAFLEFHPNFFFYQGLGNEEDFPSRQK